MSMCKITLKNQMIRRQRSYNYSIKYKEFRSVDLVITDINRAFIFEIVGIKILLWVLRYIWYIMGFKIHKIYYGY